MKSLMDKRWEQIGYCVGMAAAADQAKGWAMIARQAATVDRRRKTPEEIAEFEFALKQLDKTLLHAYVIDRVASGVEALGRSLRTHAADEASEALAAPADVVSLDDVETPVQEISFTEESAA